MSEWTCSCPLGECHDAGGRGCYFGTAPQAADVLAGLRATRDADQAHRLAEALRKAR